MADDIVRIERMTLRVVGLSQEEARHFGQEVVERLALRVESGVAARSFGSVRLRVTTATHTSDRRALAEQIAQRTLKGVGQ